MSIRNLDSLFAPASVAIFGASNRPASVGGTVWRNMRSGRFAGAVYAVNPKHRELDGQPVYAGVAELPEVPGGYLRAQGTRRLVATVLPQNVRMRELARLLGFVEDAEQPERDTIAIHLDLQAAAAARG